MKRGAEQLISPKGKKIKTEQIQYVPNEIWQVIFAHLPPFFWGTVRQISTGWHALVHNLSEQSLYRYFPYLINHPDYQARPLNLFVQEYQQYHQWFSSIPMDTIFSVLQENAESVVSEANLDSQKILYGLRFAKGYPLPVKGLSEENILEIKGWAIFFAAWQGNTQIFEELLVLEGINAQYKNKALWSAAQNGHAEMVAQLVAHGVSVNITNHDSTTLVHIAAKNGHVDVIAKLVELGVDVNVALSDGRTLVHIAAWKGRVEAIVKLVELGANVNTSNNHGATPIHIAAQNGHAKAIVKLVDLGANVNTSNNHGATPIHIAAQNGQAEAIAKLGALGANVNTPNNRGATPIHIATYNGHAKAIAKLVELEADVNIPNNRGVTPIFIAAQNGHAKVVQSLLSANVNIQPYVSSAESLSNFAQSRGSMVIDRMNQFIKEKIEEGNHVEKIPLLPSEIAYIMGHDEIVNMFKTSNEVVTAIESHLDLQPPAMTFVFNAKKDSSSFSGEENKIKIEKNNHEQSSFLIEPRQ